jgi:transcriptional regulator with XRE-family HTH domain/quercetin dioxygenase-like cupin family protein
MERGMTVRGLARMVDLSASLISQIETGRSSPSVSTLYAITAALDISIEDVFSAGSPRRSAAGDAPNGATADAVDAVDAKRSAQSGRRGRNAAETAEISGDAAGSAGGPGAQTAVDAAAGAGGGVNTGTSEAATAGVSGGVNTGMSGDDAAAGAAGGVNAGMSGNAAADGSADGAGAGMSGNASAATVAALAGGMGAGAPGNVVAPAGGAGAAGSVAAAGALAVADRSANSAANQGLRQLQRKRRVGPVVAAGEREVLQLDSGVTWELLGQLPDAHVDFLRITYAPGGSSSGAGVLMRHSGTEFGHVLSGQLTLTLGFDTYVLNPGDSVSFDCSTPHSYANHGTEPAMGVWFVAER